MQKCGAFFKWRFCVDIASLREKAASLPLTPGVYLMRDSNGKVIYVGKAKKLQNRVSSYFVKNASHTLKTRKMVSNVADFEVINAPSELDAFLLENTLIKKYKPKYNILLKDDKGYPFIKLSSGDFPTFSVSGKREKDGKYFGPYGGRGTANAALRAINEIFAFPTCKKRFPQDIGKSRPCLRYHLGKCMGVCTGNVTKSQYNSLISEAEQIFSGKGKALEKKLNEQMTAASDELEFEKAAALRDKLQAIEKLRAGNLVCAASADYDAVGFALRGTRGCVAALSFKDGNLIGKRIVFYDGADEEDESANVQSFIHQYYQMLGTAPHEIYVPCAIEEHSETEEMLMHLRKGKCYIRVALRGEKLKMVELASQNAENELVLMEKKEQYSQKTVRYLADMLGIEVPTRIEAFDISNTAGSDAVASMTVFTPVQPLKSAYRKFKIELAAPGDDCAAMAEVMGRRLDRAISGDEGFLPLPSLFLMDGGYMQVQAALSQLKKRNIDIPVFGMIKDDKHRTRGLITEQGAEIGLAATPAVFALIGRIQEETHRFAIGYHHTLHANNAKKSELDLINKIGQSRKNALFKHFKSIKAIKSASFQELCRIVPKDAAEEIIRYFEREEL